VTCRAAGQSLMEAYSFFLNGRSADGVLGVDLSEYLDRGYKLLDLQDKWIDLWDPKD
jgi:hypothetical protein